MICYFELSDDEVGRVWGQPYRNYLSDGHEGNSNYDTFRHWFYCQTGYRIFGKQDEDGAAIAEWYINFPSESDMVQFKLKWL